MRGSKAGESGAQFGQAPRGNVVDVTNYVLAALVTEEIFWG
jgi:hypothetical protein